MIHAINYPISQNLFNIFCSVILALVRLRRMNPESFFAYRRIPDPPLAEE